MPLLAAALAAALTSPAPAQGRDSPSLDVARTETPPVIDGVLDDPAWTDAPVIDELWQVEPVEGAPPTRRTEVRIVYDDDFMYFGVRCFDDEPDRIIATQLKRDGIQEADDRVEIVIDPFFDRRNGYLFSTNPVGARLDALLEANRLVLVNWDGIWYAGSTIDEQGWSAEIAIPFKTISFNPRTSRWSFNIERTVRRDNERIRWSSPQQNKRLTSVADAGVLEGIEGISQGLGLDVKPWGKLVYEDEDAGDDDVDLDGGVDVFYKLTPSLTLSLTVNTDFAETEVDERQVNLTRFPLFFPEKRDFFLQDEGLFEFGGIRRNPLPFFSRRIGLSPTGQPVDLIAGAKLTGRVG
ncbi:MAG: carbohydrate binding family 9 domain-containing protein, partial [Planctomycetota bacterium]